jgi:hypothetical protein
LTEKQPENGFMFGAFQLALRRRKGYNFAI